MKSHEPPFYDKQRQKNEKNDPQGAGGGDTADSITTILVQSSIYPKGGGNAPSLFILAQVPEHRNTYELFFMFKLPKLLSSRFFVLHV